LCPAARGKLPLMVAPIATPAERNEFLEKDLLDALRWLFVGAVTWHATKGQPGCALGMYTNLVQARALYEFYFAPEGSKPDDARACNFTSSPWTEPPSTLYVNYMAKETPANKRVFHLVYRRSDPRNAGGPDDDETDHLKNQVLNFAKDLRRITEAFVACTKPELHAIAQTALAKALAEAQATADRYSIRNPL
jgi:hypothetical protein